MSTKPEKWALFDLDSSLADFEESILEHLKLLRHPDEPEVTVGDWENDPAWLDARKSLIKRQPGFWQNLKTIPFGMELYHYLGDLGYQRMILTKGPRKNPMAWAEKVIWCGTHVPDAEITITLKKGLSYGKILYDDYPPYIRDWLKHRPRGKVLMLDAPQNQDFTHPQVLRCYRRPLQEQLHLINTFLEVV